MDEEIADLADRIRERQRRGEDFELEFELEWGALTEDERDRFMVLVGQRIARGVEVLEAIEANVRVLQALLVLLVSKAPGMDLGEAVHYGHIGWMEVIETIRTADVLLPPPSR